jgi:hypothetical protein
MANIRSPRKVSFQISIFGFLQITEAAIVTPRLKTLAPFKVCSFLRHSYFSVIRRCVVLRRFTTSPAPVSPCSGRWKGNREPDRASHRASWATSESPTAHARPEVGPVKALTTEAFLKIHSGSPTARPVASYVGLFRMNTPAANDSGSVHFGAQCVVITLH